jgi:hypothetical protein
MVSMFQGPEAKFNPAACEFWQIKRIPYSPLYPKTKFLRWLHTDSEENYRRRGNKDFTESSVGYEFNNLGYRGNDFSREQNRPGVLFLGDSNTLGLGTPWEGLWTTLVIKQLEQFWHIPVQQYNLAWGGTGPDYTAMMVHQVVEVLRPAAVCILWSFTGRMTWFPDTRRQVHFIPEWMPEAYRNEHSAYLRLATEAQTFFNYVRNFHIVNDRLARLHIPYYWGNLEQFSQEMLRPYVPLEQFVGNWKALDLARDGRHAGLKSHLHFANLILAAIKKNAPLQNVSGPL